MANGSTRTTRSTSRVPAYRAALSRPKWTITIALLVVFAGLLIVEAYVNAKFTPDFNHEYHSRDSVPKEVLGGGPIIDLTGPHPRSYRLPPRTIALTFDDGPDPVWTPRILDVLRRHQAHATFFVLGSQVARHPELTRRIAAEGHELGVHTFTHPDLVDLPGWRRRMEYAHTQSAIAGAAGVHTTLLRFPYSSRPEAIDDLDWPVVREAGQLGYLVVVNDTDSQDWARPGVDAIVRNMEPPIHAGAVVLLHDAGGNRAQTVAALDRFIPAMRAKGYEFTTVTEGVARVPGTRTDAQPEVTGNVPATQSDRWRGAILVRAVHIADLALKILTFLFFAVGALMLARTALLFVLAGRHAQRRRSATWSWGPPVTAPVSVIVPAYNEREGIAATVRSLAASDHPEVEVIVVDDGSTDGTAEIVEALALPNVRVIRKANEGKATALNTGIAQARHELIVTVDGDTIFEPDSIRRLVQPFADPSVGAVSGNVKVGNRQSLVARWQHIEYVIGFNLDRRLYEALRCMPTVPGAIAAFRRRALLSAGGMSHDTLAEDTDITVAVIRAGWHVVYEEKARAWTEAPTTLGQLWRQRYRWSYGTMQAMWKHRRAVRESGASGRFGRRGLPFLAFFGVALPLLAPLIDLMALYGFFFLDRTSTLVGWLAMLGLQALTAVIAFRLDREPLRALAVLPVQQFIYRQLMYLVLLQSMVTALTGSRLRWQKLQRTGQAAPGGAAPGAAVDTAGAAGPAEKPRTRDRWFDTLRAAALTRVFVYHLFPVAWLSFVFPAMGVMFAIGGSLMARSIDRGAVPAITNRLRRLLPALWVLAALLVPPMLWFDWPDRPAWSQLWTWVIPVTVPPGSPWAESVTTVLWYLVAYLWLVLLSPALLWFYRRRPLLAVLLPLAVLVGLENVPSLLDSATASAVTDVATFGACWIVGFAHRDGTLRRLPLAALLTLAVLNLGIGAAWALMHPSTWGGFDLNAIPIGQALYSLGFVLLLLRAAPAMAWLARARPLDRLVSVLNARAVTVYLWHNLAIAACFPLGNVFGVGRLGMVGYLVVAVAILVLIVLALGWVEDLAARRPARLLPPSGKVPTDATPPDVGSPAPEPALAERGGPSTTTPSS